jgi:hypothetical protein
MARYLQADGWLGPLAGERFGATRRYVIQAYNEFWRFRFPSLFVAFVVALAWCAARTEAGLVGVVALVSILSLTVILAKAGRYVLLVEPLMCIVAVAGALRISREGVRAVGRVLRSGSHLRPVTGVVLLGSFTWLAYRVGPHVTALAAEKYHLETTAALAARRLPAAFGPRRLMRQAVSPEGGCARVAATVALRALGVGSVRGRETSLSGWDADCPELAGRNLFRSRDFEASLTAWRSHPDSRGSIEVLNDANSADPLWHVRYSGGNWALMTQSLVLQPESLYVYEMMLKSTAPVVALYWQVEIGRSLAADRAYPEWTHLAYVFITPGWDSNPKIAHFSPILVQAPGDVWVRQLHLYKLEVPSL